MLASLSSSKNLRRCAGTSVDFISILYLSMRFITQHNVCGILAHDMPKPKLQEMRILRNLIFWSKNQKSTQRFCSTKCGGAGRHKPATVPKRMQPRETRACSFCGTEFKFRVCPSTASPREGKYCSKKCKYDGLKLSQTNCCLRVECYSSLPKGLQGIVLLREPSYVALQFAKQERNISSTYVVF